MSASASRVRFRLVAVKVLLSGVVLCLVGADAPPARGLATFKRSGTFTRGRLGRSERRFGLENPVAGSRENVVLAKVNGGLRTRLRLGCCDGVPGCLLERTHLRRVGRAGDIHAGTRAGRSVHLGR
jgi:hypothetical protein